MATAPRQCDLLKVLADLESSWDAVPWIERRAVAGSLGEVLPQADQHDVGLRLFRLFADDPKWEVRKEIACLLPLLSDDEFAPLAAKLTEDSNGYVRKAAERSFNRRRRGVQEGGRRRGGIVQVFSGLDAIAHMHGNRVAEKVRQLAEQLYDVMAGAAVHELRGILTPLKATAGKLRDEARRPSPNQTAIGNGLDTIAKRLDLLERFINDMRAYSEPVPVERRPARLKEVVTEACNIAIDHLRTSGCDLDRIAASISVDSEITLPVARHYVVAAVRHVLTNAYEAVLAHEDRVGSGRITLEACVVEGTEVRIVVEDNGVGISADDLRELLAFVPGRISKKGNGTGFGLPTAQRYVEAHGGALVIESTENVGTTVSIILPLDGWSEAGK